jgi:hypothetical protein
MRLPRARFALLTICGLTAALPSSAQAAALPNCSAPATSAQLSAFGDPRAYFLAPGGDFEAADWTLTGGATLTPGSGPLRLGTARTSLRLPAGASATSSAFCVDLDYPTLRFFSSQKAAVSSTKLNVEVLYPALRQGKNALRVTKGTSGWALSPDVRLRPERVDKAAGWRTVQIRFTADKAAKADWRVDDVLVDPRMRG